MANFLGELEQTMAKLAEHLKPTSGAYVEALVGDMKNILGTLLADIKGELAYIHSRIDQSDNSFKNLADATVGVQTAVSPEAIDTTTEHELPE